MPEWTENGLLPSCWLGMGVKLTEPPTIIDDFNIKKLMASELFRWLVMLVL
jgi:hypothetical protein